MDKRISFVVFVILTGIVIIAALIFTALLSNNATAGTGFVTRTGTKFYLENEEFKFVGFNYYDAAASSFYKCAWWDRLSDNELDTAMKYMKQKAGASVLRFWAFQKYTAGGTNFSGIDRVINIAKQNNMKVIPVLENGQKHCTGNDTLAKYEVQGWYVNGYKLPWGSDPISYRDYVQLIVNRYKNEPTIMAWMMMNEADISEKNAQGKSVLVDFVADIGALIKGIDTNHLLTVGTQSNGVSGSSGSDFIAVYGSPYIDFTEGHDWAFWGSDTDPLPGSADGITLPDPNSAFCLQTYQNKIACSIAQSIKILNKPFLMGESGMAASNDAERLTRSNRLNAKMNAAFSNGVAGYLIWQYNNIIDPYESFDILSTTNDPLIPKMKLFTDNILTDPPVIEITAPTKNSATNITDTTIKITSYVGININDITVSNLSTVNHSSFNCIQTTYYDIDCTITITSSGNLVINARDLGTAGNTATESNYSIMEITPTPTNTPVPTNTPSPTFTPTPLGTPTPTPTGTLTPTPTPTNTPIPTPTNTTLPTPTNTLVPTPTKIPVPTTTKTPTATPTKVIVINPTFTPTPTRRPALPTATKIPNPIFTPTVIADITNTPTITIEPTETTTPTVSVTDQITQPTVLPTPKQNEVSFGEYLANNIVYLLLCLIPVGIAAFFILRQRRETTF